MVWLFPWGFGSRLCEIVIVIYYDIYNQWLYLNFRLPAEKSAIDFGFMDDIKIQ